MANGWCTELIIHFLSCFLFGMLFVFYSETVGATDDGDFPAIFSNFGTCVNIYAPVSNSNIYCRDLENEVSSIVCVTSPAIIPI